jgi:hybrid cluster-associated redox disulfide protein|tara:strand:- start:229 stop:441 length:213 start_codon:yes stop_codon:yes gene_type:complete
MVKITKNMLLSEVVEKYPEVAMVLRGYGLYCVGCDVANIETIEQGAKAHNLDNEEIGLMLKDMNTVALEK